MDGSLDLDHTRSPPVTVALPMGQTGEASSSSSSSEVSVKFEKDAPKFAATPVDSSAAASSLLSNGGGNPSGEVGSFED